MIEIPKGVKMTYYAIMIKDMGYLQETLPATRFIGCVNDPKRATKYIYSAAVKTCHRLNIENNALDFAVMVEIGYMMIKMAQRMALRYAVSGFVHSIKLKRGVSIDNVKTLTSENVVGLLRDKCVDTITIQRTTRNETYKVSYEN